MAISSAASGDPGKAAPSRAGGRTTEPTVSDTGMELEAALPVVAPQSDVPTSPGEHPAPSAPELFEPNIAAAHLKNESPETILHLDQNFARLMREVHENRPGDDLDIIRRAWLFCLQQHEGQKRASGEPYVVHPLEVALVLAELKMDSTAIAAGVLHGAGGDTDVASGEIAGRFGDPGGRIVERGTELGKIKFAKREEQ